MCRATIYADIPPPWIVCWIASFSIFSPSGFCFSGLILWRDPADLEILFHRVQQPPFLLLHWRQWLSSLGHGRALGYGDSDSCCDHSKGLAQVDVWNFLHSLPYYDHQWTDSSRFCLPWQRVCCSISPFIYYRVGCCRSITDTSTGKKWGKRGRQRKRILSKIIRMENDTLPVLHLTVSTIYLFFYDHCHHRAWHSTQTRQSFPRVKRRRKDWHLYHWAPPFMHVLYKHMTAICGMIPTTRTPEEKSVISSV